MIENKRIFANGINLIAGKVGASVISIVNIMVLTRLLSTEEMGVYSLFMMMANLALVFGLTWTDGALVRFGREEYLDTKKKSINDAFWVKVIIFVLCGFIFSISFLLFSKDLSEYVGISNWEVLLIIGVFILNGLMSFMGAVFRSIDQIKTASYILTLQKLSYFIGLCLVYVIDHEGLVYIFVSLNISYLLTILFNMKKLNFSVVSKFNFNKIVFKKMWSLSWPVFIGASGIYVVNYVDLFVIKLYMNDSDVGIYSVAYSGFMSICSVIMLMQTLFMPLIVEYKHKGRFDLVRNYVKNLYRYIFAWVAISAIGLSCTDFVIPFLFTDSYVSAIQSFNILLITSIFYFCSISLLPIVSAFDLMIAFQGINLMRSVVNAGMDFYLVPSMGIAGAAYATLISFVMGMMLTVILIYLNRKKLYGY
ncbi:MAG: oligosaccharide flippase family protein [Gammaproteobacteria bacterium]|nr:oligosaccharide flippase family protein [Gammaproteobacteria bacterium]